jgi:hypothetical protein
MNQVRRHVIQNYQAERGNATRDGHSEGIYHDFMERFSLTQQMVN